MTTLIDNIRKFFEHNCSKNISVITSKKIKTLGIGFHEVEKKCKCKKCGKEWSENIITKSY